MAAIRIGGGRSTSLATIHEYISDPELGWKNREGQFDMLDPRRNVFFHYTNWSRGRRATSDRESALDSARTPSVLFFGDSYVQGYGLSNAQTFAWMVQARHPEVAVSNFGTADYGTYQSYLAIAKYAHGPCSVFYLFNGFHEGRNVADQDWLRMLKPPPPNWFFPYADLRQGTLAGARISGRYGVAGEPMAAHCRAGAGLLYSGSHPTRVCGTSAALRKLCW